ncbi:hypothetical protein [Reyranella soli]|nr:hypothetical protein [Reyranella soli]
MTQVNPAVAPACHHAPAIAKEAIMDIRTKDRFGYLGTEPTALREQLDQLAAALQDLAKAEGAEAIKAANEAARRIAEQANAIVKELGDKADAVGAVAAKGRSQAEEAIRKQPLAAVSLAAAAGFLLAMLVRR